MDNFNKDFYEYVKEKTQDITQIKHIKGYIYDSLVYRYIRAREQMAEYEYMKDTKKEHDKAYYRLQANRDIMRFCQILDEAIGAHD